MTCDWVEGVVAGTCDAQAKTDLRNGLAISKAYYAMNQTWVGVLAEAPAIEPNLALAELSGAAVG
ncbi:MAG: hypothetical protein GY778_20940, partial [bacterium]|nr:hypothetical protein [bacterium]